VAAKRQPHRPLRIRTQQGSSLGHDTNPAGPELVQSIAQRRERLRVTGSMLGELVRAVLERALEAELTAHLGYERNDRADRGGGGHGNYRNGSIAKTVQTGVGPVGLACRGTGPARSSRCWCPSGPGGSPAAWTT
jgi:hypothetical protein